jgi:signal transduction histidine kinase/ActR/RegA family two-component response regulator
MLFRRREQPQARAANPDPERALVWLRLAVLASAVVPAALSAGAAWLGYVEAVEATHARLRELARVAEENVGRVLERNDVVLQQMLLILKDDDDQTLRKREPQLHEIAAAILLRLPHIGALSVKNAQGEVLVSTLLPPAPRFASGPDWSVFGERPAAPDPFTVTKPRVLASGAAGGTVELTLKRAYFEELLRRLVDEDRRVGVALLYGEKPPSAGEQRYAAYRRIGEGPLYVAATQEEGGALAEWRARLALLVAVVLPVTAALVLASGLALRRTRREIEARRRLREEAESRGRAEDALRQAQKLDALGQLAGGLAHDFNNLLMVVSANAELLARVVPQAGARPELVSILRAVDGGGKLTRRLLGFSRKAPPQPEVLDLPAALEDMLDLLRTTAGDAVEISLQAEDGAPPVEADRAELEMALINLVANARDAMGHRGRIRIHLRPARPGEGPEALAHGYAIIAVSDTGQGMSADVLKRAFEPFFTTKPAGVGTGLGLAQVYGFCAQAGGDVELASKLRVGTTVSMLLPATAKAVPRVQALAQAALESRPLLSARVLLVEDSAELASTMAAALERLGCAVTPVTTAQEAERLALAPGRFDVVLSDVVMPGADGIALAQRLRKRKPDLPVVLITGVSGQARQAVPSGVEVLAKPCGAREIAGALARAIAERRPAAPMH